MTRGRMADEQPPAGTGTGVAGPGTDDGAPADSIARGAVAPRQVILLPDDILKLIGTFVPDPPNMKWDITMIKELRSPSYAKVIVGTLSIASGTQGVRVCQMMDTGATETVTHVEAKNLRRVLNRALLVCREHFLQGHMKVVSTAHGVTVSCTLYSGSMGMDSLKELLFSPLEAGQ